MPGSLLIAGVALQSSVLEAVAEAVVEAVTKAVAEVAAKTAAAFEHVRFVGVHFS